MIYLHLYLSKMHPLFPCLRESDSTAVQLALCFFPKPFLHATFLQLLHSHSSPSLHNNEILLPDSHPRRRPLLLTSRLIPPLQLFSLGRLSTPVSPATSQIATLPASPTTGSRDPHRPRSPGARCRIFAHWSLCRCVEGIQIDEPARGVSPAVVA